jgi:hypothetical protein
VRRQHTGRVIGHCCARVTDSASAVSRERLSEASIEQERESNRCAGEPTGSDRGERVFLREEKALRGGEKRK